MKLFVIASVLAVAAAGKNAGRGLFGIVNSSNCLTRTSPTTVCSLFISPRSGYASLASLALVILAIGWQDDNLHFVLMAAFVRTLIRWDANQTSTKYGHSIGRMTMCLVRSLESQVIGACLRNLITSGYPLIGA
ncbi:hypothetical protein OUZ56_026277 [Daphnia magna]|uniref:Secreted protein n=1 Tax=Daphnia magna TaxID=35525 RepID=A0ABQ9ZLA1_9CRUS|nr:hypothetical protein OUZ56_026277 [Daphnia magna]